MAQKMAPTRVGSKKAAKKTPSRKARHAAPAKSVKAKPKAGPAKVQVNVKAKRSAKIDAARLQARKVAAHSGKAAVHSAGHKAPMKAAPVKQAVKAKESIKGHAAPKHETAKPAVAPSKGVAKVPIMPPPARPAAPSAARAIPAAVAKTASQKIMAPAAPPARLPEPAQQPGAAQAQQASAAAAAKKPVHQRHGFKVNEWIVYPAHGVGRIVAIEEQEIAGISLELFVITFEKDKMTLRVPTGKSESVGMRKLAEEPTVKKAVETLKGRARIKRTMWSRRAQEYEAKINSGDLISIAEVVRDLYRSESQPEQSYSERQLYEAALDRMAREIAVVEKLDERGAVQRITEVLAKSARGRGVAAAEAA
jgi:CarD family transcriptional regulator, regulator of rRNA transcription